MTKTALITGASSGIGAEMARYHAAKGGDVILTARRVENLNALKAELETAHGMTAHVFAADLTAPAAPAELHAAVKKAGLSVDILINNAGFGGHGIHIDRDLGDEQRMIDLNVKALVALTHAFGGDMAQRGGGKILNVASTAGFMPGPLQAVYFATKAFVVSYSQAIDEELRDRGVTVTALCPGYVVTEFAAAADLDGTNLVASGGATPASVAECGYEAMMAGKLIAINERKLSFLIGWIMPYMPRRAALKMIRKMQTKKA